jgi:anti-repressor protein
MNNLLPIMPADPAATMSSLLIAEITGKPHRNVTADITRILAEAEIDEQGFLHIYRDTQNREQKCYLLPRRECDLVVSGYSVKYRLAIIDRWRELEAKQTGRDPIEALQDPSVLRLLLMGYAEKVIEQKAALAIAAPKVEFYDTVTESGTVCSMAVAAQVANLPFGRNTLFIKLREKGALISCGDRYNLPKQEFIERGYFTVKENNFEHPTTGEVIIKFTTQVTQKGIDWLIRTFGTRNTQAKSA